MKNTILIALLFLSIGVSAQTNINYEYDNLQRLTKVIYPTGSYIQYTYDANGNRTQTVTATLAVEEIAGTKNQFIVYPNPFYDEINIKSKGKKIKNVELLDFSGKLLKQTAVNNLSDCIFKVENLPTGIYMLVVVSETGKETFKIIKK